MGETPGSPTVSRKLQRIAEQAQRYPAMVFDNVLHLIDQEFLREAYRQTRRNSAPGVDQVTAQQYAEHLEDNLRDLHERLRDNRYVAPPVERVWIEKDDGKQRPIGKPCFEDKIVQRAVVMMLEAIFEPEFHGFSHGFSKGHSQHQAPHELREQCRTLHIAWIVDADVSGFFANLDWGHLREFIQQRVRDGGIWRLLGKWLHAGVLESGALSYPDKGTPQGGVITPPTKLQTFFSRGRVRGTLVDSKDHIDLIVCHFDPLHYGTNQLAFARPVCDGKPVVDLRREVFQASNNQLQLGLECRFILELLGLGFEGREALPEAGNAGFKFQLVNAPLGVAVDQPGEALPQLPDLRLKCGLLLPLRPARSLHAAAIFLHEARRMGEQSTDFLPDCQVQESSTDLRIVTDALASKVVGIGAETAIIGIRASVPFGGFATNGLAVQGIATVVALH